MIHTDLPAIVSFNTWSYSPDLPSIHLNYSIACKFRYRLDQGGAVETFSSLTIPSQVSGFEQKIKHHSIFGSCDLIKIIVCICLPPFSRHVRRDEEQPPFQ